MIDIKLYVRGAVGMGDAALGLHKQDKQRSVYGAVISLTLGVCTGVREFQTGSSQLYTPRLSDS